MITFTTSELILLCRLGGEQPRLTLPVVPVGPVDWQAVLAALIERGVLEAGDDVSDPGVTEEWRALLGLVVLAPRITTFSRLDDRGLEFTEYLRVGEVTVLHRLVGEEHHALAPADPSAPLAQLESILAATPEPDDEPPHAQTSGADALLEAGTSVLTVSDRRFEDGAVSMAGQVIVERPGRRRLAADLHAGDVASSLVPASDGELRALMRDVLGSSEAAAMR